MSEDKFSIPFDRLRKSIDDSKNLIPKFREIFYALKPEVDALSEYIDTVATELNSPPPITIALLGSTGAGKSTLINRIVGVDVLPNSGSKVCTAGITRLKYADTDDFRITVTITDLKYWEQEIASLSSVLNAEGNSQEEIINSGASDAKLSISREERERFLAVYGIPAFEEFSKTRDRSHLVLPEKVSEAFRRKVMTISVSDSKSVLDEAKKYLVTTNSENQNFEHDQLWPIVESVLIEGRFEAIKHGSEIVDLPGLNDPNPAREARTYEFLKIAKFIFIAYEAKRQPTKDIRDVLKSRDLMSTIISTGKAHALTFIATKVDEFSEDDQDFSDFPEEATNEVLALHRKSLIRQKLSGAILEIAEEASEGAENESEKLLIRDSIINSQTFISSAQDYALLTKRQQGMKTRTSPKFEHVSDTEIPSLREHVNELTLRVGPEVIFNRIHNNVSGIAQQMQMIMNLEFAKFIMQNQAFTEKSEALQQRITDITNELDSVLRGLSVEFGDAVDEKTNDFFLRIGKGANAAPRIQREMSNFLRGLHWMTARATTSRGGRFYSNSRGYIDLSAEVATPIIETITYPWSAFFGTALQDLMEILQIHLTKGVDDFVVKTRHTINDQDQLESVESLIKAILRNVDEVAQNRIQVAKELFSREVEQTRSSLVELIRECVEEELEPVFYRASDESGAGMKMRMTDTIVEAVGEVVPKAFETAHEKIQLTVNASMAKVQKLIDEMTRVLIADARRIESVFSKLENNEKIFDEVKANSLMAEVDSLTLRIQEIELSVEPVPEIVVEKPVKPKLLLDGSNVATETDLTRRKISNLDILLSCKLAIENEFPGHELIIFVDATFKFYLPSEQQLKFEALELSGEITRTPGGVVADSVILKTATRNNARVISKDRYRDWVKSYPIVAEPGRIIAPTYIAATNQWEFNSRTRI